MLRQQSFKGFEVDGFLVFDWMVAKSPAIYKVCNDIQGYLLSLQTTFHHLIEQSLELRVHRSEWWSFICFSGFIWWSLIFHALIWSGKSLTLSNQCIAFPFFKNDRLLADPQFDYIRSFILTSIESRSKVTKQNTKLLSRYWIISTVMLLSWADTKLNGWVVCLSMVLKRLLTWKYLTINVHWYWYVV